MILILVKEFKRNGPSPIGHPGEINNRFSWDGGRNPLAKAESTHENNKTASR